MLLADDSTLDALNSAPVVMDDDESELEFAQREGVRLETDTMSAGTMRRAMAGGKSRKKLAEEE